MLTGCCKSNLMHPSHSVFKRSFLSLINHQITLIIIIIFLFIVSIITQNNMYCLRLFGYSLRTLFVGFHFDSIGSLGNSSTLHSTHAHTHTSIDELYNNKIKNKNGIVSDEANFGSQNLVSNFVHFYLFAMAINLNLILLFSSITTGQQDVKFEKHSL